MKEITVSIPDASSVRRFALKLGLVLLVLYIAYAVRDIWLPLGLAFLLAMVLDPVVDRMERRGWGRTSAAAFIFGSFLFITGGLITLSIPYLGGQVEALQEGFARYFPDTTHDGLVRSFRQMNLPDWLANLGVSVFEGVVSGFERSSTWLTEYGMRFVSNLIWIVIVPIVAFYALRDFHLILAKGLLLVPKSRRDLVQTAVGEITVVFARFLRGLALVSLLNGIATWALLLVLRVPSALLIGIVAGILYSVPYLGAVLTLVLTAAVAFLGGGVEMMTIALVTSTILHQIVFDQIISPRVLGGHVGLHPILSIMALLIGNLLLGIIGMILAVPIAACIQIAVLALVPKLAEEIEVPGPESSTGSLLSQLAHETQETHLQADATSELHSLVTEAVESVEQKVQQVKQEEGGPELH